MAKQGYPVNWKGSYPLLVIIGAVLLAIPLSGAVAKFGKHVPTVDVVPEHLQAILVAGLLALTLPFWSGKPWEKRVLIGVWVVKICVVLGAMLFYESQYSTIDSYSYYAGYVFDDGPPKEMAYGYGPGEGTKNVTTLVQFLKTNAGASFHTIKLLFAYAGFAACYIAYRAGCQLLKKSSFVWLLAFLVTPSMLFWTGILGKDPLVALGVSTFLYGASLYWTGQKPIGIGWIAVGFFIAASIRLWLLLAMLPGLGYLVAKTAQPKHRVSINVLFAVALCAGAVWLAISRGITGPNDLVPALAKVSQQWAEGGSAQKLEVPFSSVGGLLAFMPYGAFTALYRPLPLEVMNAFGMLAGFENACLLGFAIYILLKHGVKPLRDKRIVFLFLLLIGWSLIYSLISFQNLGTASRFRVQAMPILLLLYWMATSYSLRPTKESL